MIRKRIHTLYATLSGGSSTPTTDENGNIIFSSPSSGNIITHSCRAESNTIDPTTKVTDGYRLDYQYLVFTDTRIQVLPMGTKVEIKINSDGSVFGKGEVVKFERGQRVTRIWLK